MKEFPYGNEPGWPGLKSIQCLRVNFTCFIPSLTLGVSKLKYVLGDSKVGFKVGSVSKTKYQSKKIGLNQLDIWWNKFD